MQLIISHVHITKHQQNITQTKHSYNTSTRSLPPSQKKQSYGLRWETTNLIRTEFSTVTGKTHRLGRRSKEKQTQNNIKTSIYKYIFLKQQYPNVWCVIPTTITTFFSWKRPTKNQIKDLRFFSLYRIVHIKNNHQKEGSKNINYITQQKKKYPKIFDKIRSL